MEKYTLDNIKKLLEKMQDDNRKLTELADETAIGIDRALLRLGIIQRGKQ